MNADEITLRNDTHVKPFKCQIYLYTLALGKLQGYIPPCGYILGRGWSLTRQVNKKKIKTKVNDPFDKLGTIDYEGRDEYYKTLANDAINWYRQIKTTDEKLSHDPPSMPELYPNLCNTYDGKYHKIKQQIAEKYNDITSVWKCGPEQRNNAFAKGICKWSDPKCTAELMKVNGEYTRNRINSILNFNRSKTKELITPKKINMNELKNTNIIYVDFETINDILLSSTVCNSDLEEYIFMIGVGHIKNGNWIYKNFTTHNISKEEEFRIMNEFIQYIDEIKESNNYKLIHWSGAEPSMYNKACNRHKIDRTLEWFDLLKMVEKKNILIKGVLKFGLKKVAKKLNEYGLIKTIWSNDILNGNDAMFTAWKLYLKKEPITNPIFKQIIDYNEIDVKVMYEIVECFMKIS